MFNFFFTIGTDSTLCLSVGLSNNLVNLRTKSRRKFVLVKIFVFPMRRSDLVKIVPKITGGREFFFNLNLLSDLDQILHSQPLTP